MSDANLSLCIWPSLHWNVWKLLDIHLIVNTNFQNLHVLQLLPLTLTFFEGWWYREQSLKRKNSGWSQSATSFKELLPTPKEVRDNELPEVKGNHVSVLVMSVSQLALQSCQLLC